jgi:hypothetical protein
MTETPESWTDFSSQRKVKQEIERKKILYGNDEKIRL